MVTAAWEESYRLARDVGFHLSQVSTATGSVPQVMHWSRRELVLWPDGIGAPKPGLGQSHINSQDNSQEIFPKNHWKMGLGTDLGLVEPRPVTLRAK